MTPDELLKEELRPCPFCNKNPIQHRRGFVWCDCLISNKNWAFMYPKKGWDSAYCWKEIATLQAKIEELEKQLKDQRAVNKYEPGDFRGSEQ